MSKAIENALTAIGSQINSLPKADRSEFIEALACLSIGLLRGRFGDEFAHGFLTEAIKDTQSGKGRISIRDTH